MSLPTTRASRSRSAPTAPTSPVPAIRPTSTTPRRSTRWPTACSRPPKPLPLPAPASPGQNAGPSPPPTGRPASDALPSETGPTSQPPGCYASHPWPAGGRAGHAGNRRTLRPAVPGPLATPPDVRDRRRPAPRLAARPAALPRRAPRSRTRPHPRTRTRPGSRTMTLTINDTTMTSDQTAHTARQAVGSQHLWEVSWLPGQALDVHRELGRRTWPDRIRRDQPGLPTRHLSPATRPRKRAARSRGGTMTAQPRRHYDRKPEPAAVPQRIPDP